MSNYIGIPPDHIVHDDVVFASDAVPPLWDITEELRQVWEMGVTGEGVVIAVNDTMGIPDHHHLPEPVASKNYTSDPNGRDGNGHGHWCAGRALGREGVGVAPEASLIAFKVLSNRGSGASSWINQAREDAGKAGADVISESLGSSSGSADDVRAAEAAYKAGTQICVAAAGNAGYRGGNTIGYPAKWPVFWCKGAFRRDGNIANFSSGGREIDSACPGEQVTSCRPGGGWATMSGTSMSTPFFAGLMALIIHKRRMGGAADIIGAEAWRDWFQKEGFFEDAGAPGKDVRFGMGKPLILNIIRWLQDKEPVWI